MRLKNQIEISILYQFHSKKKEITTLIISLSKVTILTLYIFLSFFSFGPDYV